MVRIYGRDHVMGRKGAEEEKREWNMDPNTFANERERESDERAMRLESYMN